MGTMKQYYERIAQRRGFIHPEVTIYFPRLLQEEEGYPPSFFITLLIILSVLSLTIIGTFIELTKIGQREDLVV